MKRILPLILALVAGMAQADSNSDYRAGSDFARQIQGQGTGSIQSFKPQESIPGYNANPDETKYYGGVTAGGDGGLKNDGTTEWATGETGKTITESFMNKPKDILSPDAPFIQTGRDVVNRADSIVGNTGQQCSAQEISRSEYTNYTRDEIERLWNPQGMAVQPAQPAADTSARTEKPAPRWFRLSNGRQVNLADWKVVLFMQGHCPYCHQFDPVLKQLAQQYGFSVFPYTLDGQGDTAFPEALPVPPDVMQTFFPNIPVATPTTFLVNVNTLEALPLLQGATDAASFMARMDTVLQIYGEEKGAK